MKTLRSVFNERVVTKVYIVQIDATEEGEASYILGVYSDLFTAGNAAIEETTKPNTSLWIKYRIDQYTLDQTLKGIYEGS